MNHYPTFMIGIILLPAIVTATIIRVPQDQATIQAGINAAFPGDTVLVADSTYYENINFKGKAINVASYFYVDGDTNHINNTIINGSQPADPSQGSVVSFTSGEDTTSVICGFTITGGTGTLYNATFKIGGGVYCKDSGARISHNKIVHNAITHNKECHGGGIGTWPIINTRYVVIEDNLIEANSLHAVNGSDGGGIRLTQGRIIHNRINSNSSYSQSGLAVGGGVYAYCDEIPNRTLVKIIDNVITNNKATSDYIWSGYGGGVDVVWCNIELVRNTITFNTISGPGLLLGGGVRIWGPKDICLIKDNIISFNSIINGDECYGGGMDVIHSGCVLVQGNRFEGNYAKNAGGGLATGHNTGCVVSDNEFISNTADWGGGLVQGDNIQLTVTNNLFLQNTALYGGGGLWSAASDMLFTNNIVAKNTARRGGGAGFDNVWYEVPPQARLINNTFTENIADTAGGIFMLDYEVVAMNNICWGNVAPYAPEIMIRGGAFYTAYSNISYGQDSIKVMDGSTLDWLEGNIDSDPLFYDPVIDNYQLTENSACVGHGIDSLKITGTMYICPVFDFEGNARPNSIDEYVDIGALESPYSRATAIEEADRYLPVKFLLDQNFPNPFNPKTVISYQLPVFSYVDLSIYNILGQKVATLVSEKQPAGFYKVEWDATGLASGVYLYRMITDKDFTLTKKLVVLK